MSGQSGSAEVISGPERSSAVRRGQVGSDGVGTDRLRRLVTGRYSDYFVTDMITLRNSTWSIIFPIYSGRNSTLGLIIVRPSELKPQ